MERHNGGAGTHTRQTHAHISDLSLQDYILQGGEAKSPMYVIMKAMMKAR